MKKHIFIALQNIDRAEHLLPYLDEIARPGTQFDIFIRTRASNWSLLQARLTALEINNSGAVQFCQRGWRDQIDLERHAAERKLSTLKQDLLGRGADIRVWIYSGSLKRALKEFVRGHRSCQIVMPMSYRWITTSFLRRTFRSLTLGNKAEVFAVVLAYPNRTAA
ncbi:MAG: hypothetical protein ACXW6K_13585 [Candidatus Binatia bacterium]